MRRPLLAAVLRAAAVYAVGCVVLVLVSRQAGPAADELPLYAAMERSAELVKRAAGRGLSELWSPEHRATLDAGWLLLAGAWSKLSLGRTGVLDPLTAMRLPWLLLGAGVPLSLYLMLRPSRGEAVALAGAAACLAMPRFAHAVVVLDEGAAVASAFWLVLAAHVRAMGPARAGEPGARYTLGWACFGALALGCGAAFSLGVLWVLPLVLGHQLWARRSRVSFRRGAIPLPTLVLVAIPVVPLCLLALRPGLWKASPAAVARFLLAPLEPSVARTELAGRLVERLPVPASFTWSTLLHTLPLALGLLALVGLGTVAHERLARRFASGSLRPPRDRHALGSLACLGLFFGVVGPWLTPDVLTTFPPRVELVLPFVALAAAIGLGRLARLTGRPRAGHALALVTLGALWVPVLGLAPTASASASPLTGGARRIAKTRVLPLGDGSEVAVLARAIDGLGRPSVTLAAPPELSPELWRWLGEARRLRTAVSVRPDGELRLSRGASASGARLADVRRDGAVLWTLAGR